MVTRSLGSRPVYRQLLLLLLSLVLVVNSYPSWLKCEIDLEDDEEIVMNYPIIMADQAEHTVHVIVSADDGKTWKKENISFVEGGMQIFKVRLEVPEALERTDLHYVLEVEGDGATFEKGMCDGRRVHGKLAMESTLILNGDAEYLDDVDLFGGWAVGHEAVSLTPITTLYLDEVEEEL